MMLYYSPGACSLADHIALAEANFKVHLAKVDLQSHKLEDGSSYYDVNPKGYVPALLLNEGGLLTENVAILSWISDAYPPLGVEGNLGRYRLLEMLGFITSEVHKRFKPLFGGGSEDEKKAAREQIAEKLSFLSSQFKGRFLFGDKMSVADAYLFVMVMWAQKQQVSIPDSLAKFRNQVRSRPTVEAVLREEGLAD